jgi:hypothetical protein
LHINLLGLCYDKYIPLNPNCKQKSYWLILLGGWLIFTEIWLIFFFALADFPTSLAHFRSSLAGFPFKRIFQTKNAIAIELQHLIESYSETSSFVLLLDE